MLAPAHRHRRPFNKVRVHSAKDHCKMVHGSLGEARLSMPRASQGEQHGLLCVGNFTRRPQQEEDAGLEAPRTEEPVGALQPSQESRGAGGGSWVGSRARGGHWDVRSFDASPHHSLRGRCQVPGSWRPGSTGERDGPDASHERSGRIPRGGQERTPYARDRHEERPVPQ